MAKMIKTRKKWVKWVRAVRRRVWAGAAEDGPRFCVGGFRLGWMMVEQKSPLSEVFCLLIFSFPFLNPTFAPK